MKNIFASHRYKGAILLALLFGFGYVTGDIFIFHPDNSFNLISLMTAIILSGLYFLFFFILTAAINHKLFFSKQIKIIKFIKTNTYRNTFVMFLLSWLVHLIIKYPAGQCPDSYTQIQMGLHPETLSTHHPLISTLIMTGIVKFGTYIGSRNLGIFLYVTLEMIMLAAVFSYSLTVLDKNLGIPDLLFAISVLFISFSPYIVGYIGQTIKDDPYTAGFILLLTLMTDFKTNRDPKAVSLRNPKMTAGLLLSAVLLLFFRKEGIMILVPCLVLLGLWHILPERRLSADLLILLAVFLFPITVNYIFGEIYSPKKGSIREMFSLPFQQTARYVIKPQDIISREETEAIGKVLQIDAIPDRYISWNSDQIKDLYNEDADKRDIINYFHAWLIGFKKAPLCYLRATLEQNIYLIFPGYNNYTYYIDANSGAAYLFGNSRPFSSPEAIINLQSEYESYLENMHTFPVLNIINNMSFYIWLLMACTVVSLNTRNKLFLQICIPLYISIVIIIFAPCIRGSVRYAFPVIWSFPLWFGCTVKNNEVSKQNF